MKFRVFLLVMFLSLVHLWNASAQERTLAGKVSVAPTRVDIKGNPAKFNEYRDLQEGVYGHIDLQYDAEETYLDFRADNMGYKDQKYELDGGRRGSFKYHLDYDEILHNFISGNGPSVRGKTFIR